MYHISVWRLGAAQRKIYWDMREAWSPWKRVLGSVQKQINDSRFPNIPLCIGDRSRKLDCFRAC
jgi:hypothetical protein